MIAQPSAGWQRRFRASGGEAAPVALDGDDLGAGAEQGSGQAARAGADLIDALALERARHARDPVEQLLVEDEILAQRLRRAEAVARDHFAQRRKVWSAGRAFTRGSRRAHSPAVRIAAIIAPGSARLLAGNVEGGAVVGRGAHDRQAEGDVDPLVEMERLERDQRLVVIHAERRVVAAPPAAVEHDVGRMRAADVDAFLAQPLDRGDDDVDLLAPEGSVLAGMRVQSCHCAGAAARCRTGAAAPCSLPGPWRRSVSIVSASEDFPQRDMGGDRNDPEGRARQHHAR